MTTYGERLRKLRKHFGLTLEQFGNRLGVQRNTISRLEREVNGLTDQMATAICREYGVSEKWLRDGDGEMFVSLSRSEKIARFAGELMREETPEFRRQIIEIFADLNDEQWEVFAEFAEKLANIKK